MEPARGDVDVGETRRERGNRALPEIVHAPGEHRAVADARERVPATRGNLLERLAGSERGDIALPGGVVAPGDDRAVAAASDAVVLAAVRLDVDDAMRQRRDVALSRSVGS